MNDPLMPAFKSQIFVSSQNDVYVFTGRCWKYFIMSFTHAPKYWKSSTTSSTVPSSMILGVESMFLGSTLVLSTFISSTTSLATPDGASSYFWVFSVLFSKKPMSSAYLISPTFFTGFCWAAACVWWNRKRICLHFSLPSRWQQWKSMVLRHLLAARQCFPQTFLWQHHRL